MAFTPRITTISSSGSHTQKALLSERINKLAKALCDGVYEREETIKLCLLAALAGESVFLLGPPGIAKSLIAKRLILAFDNSRYFEYLMTRFSTPEEVFGPLSIQELKDNGRYIRLTEGYLPQAQVVFLDEIWKAGPAILNTLLTVINEKTFKNGSDIERVPMRLLVTASNELPDEDSGLEALYDRMLVRVFVNPVQNKQNFKLMLTVGTPEEPMVPDELVITDEEYYGWQAEMAKVRLPDSVFEKLYQLKVMLENRAEEQSSPAKAYDLYVSDRRWKRSVNLLKASAFFNARDEVNPLDLLLLRDCLWHSPESHNLVVELIREFAINYAFDQHVIHQQIRQCKDAITLIKQDIEKQLCMKLLTESQGTLLRKKSDGYQYDLSKAKLYSVGNSKNLVKLIMLQSNMSVHESVTGDTRWVYVAKDELEKVIRQGGGGAYGFINMTNNMCRVHFAMNAHNCLVIKDIANRSVHTALVTQAGLDQDQHLQWCNQADQAVAQLEDADTHLRRARTNFHAALPHSFIDPYLPREIESGMLNLIEEIEDVRENSEKIVERVKSFNHYFD